MQECKVCKKVKEEHYFFDQNGQKAVCNDCKPKVKVVEPVVVSPSNKPLKVRSTKK
jgi:hypothetical protein